MRGGRCFFFFFFVVEGGRWHCYCSLVVEVQYSSNVKEGGDGWLVVRRGLEGGKGEMMA